MSTIIALIPARAGSQRIPGKNTKLLAGHPLICYTIAAAKASHVFRDIIVSTDSLVAGDIAKSMGVIYSPRPASFATSESPDIEWVRYVMGCDAARSATTFAILRPTAPFRSAATILRAKELFLESSYDSIRAVELVRQHPGKMWRCLDGERGLQPLMGDFLDGTPLHSCPTQSLPQVYVQNASLEMARTRVVNAGTISGETIQPFFTYGNEGFDLNTMDDWQFAEMKIASGEWTLPTL